MYSLYIQLFILYVYLLCISIVINRVMIDSVLLNGWCYKVHILLCLQCTYISFRQLLSTCISV